MQTIDWHRAAELSHDVGKGAAVHAVMMRSLHVLGIPWARCLAVVGAEGL